MEKYQASQRKVDLYDIGNGYTLMNIVIKNDEGKIQCVDTYIGRDDQDYIKVGTIEELTVPGTIFSYASHVRTQKFLIAHYFHAYKENTKNRNIFMRLD